MVSSKKLINDSRSLHHAVSFNNNNADQTENKI